LNRQLFLANRPFNQSADLFTFAVVFVLAELVGSSKPKRGVLKNHKTSKPTKPKKPVKPKKPGNLILVRFTGFAGFSVFQ
jgi:hypothetical protein